MTDRLYLRISLDTAVSGSIEKQRAALTDAAGSDRVEYVERSVSGAKVPFAKRPEGGRLLADLRPDDRVLVTKIDRAARNTKDLLGLVERVEAAGATIRFLGSDVDTAGANGRFTLTLLAAVAEMEGALIAERRKESLAAFRREGRHAVGSAPFGLTAAPNPNGRGLVLRPHPAEAPVLRDAVARILRGASISSVARGIGMLDTHLGRVLRNERLAGVLEQTPEGPRLDPEMAVFTLVEWSALHAFLAKPTVKEWHPAEGIGPALSCSVCGERLYRNAAANPAFATYRCRGALHAPGKAHEGAPRAAITAVNVEAHVEALFLAALGHLPMTETVTEHSDAIRVEAIALARMRQAAARAAQDTAGTEDEEDDADAAYRAARRALRDAEALPISTFSTIVETGESYADVYARGGGDRVEVLRQAGSWTVAPGRAPIADKVRFMADAQVNA